MKCGRCGKELTPTPQSVWDLDLGEKFYCVTCDLIVYHVHHDWASSGQEAGVPKSPK